MSQLFNTNVILYSTALVDQPLVQSLFTAAEPHLQAPSEIRGWDAKREEMDRFVWDTSSDMVVSLQQKYARILVYPEDRQFNGDASGCVALERLHRTTLAVVSLAVQRLARGGTAGLLETMARVAKIVAGTGPFVMSCGDELEINIAGNLRLDIDAALRPDSDVLVFATRPSDLPYDSGAFVVGGATDEYILLWQPARVAALLNQGVAPTSP